VEDKDKSIRDLILEYFKNHPKEDLPHAPVVDWVEEQSLKMGKGKPRDTWRAIRKLHQDGILIKVKKGVYRYDPDYVVSNELFDFDTETKQKVLARDGYRCVVCGRGKEDGVELTVDHKIPKDKGGDNSIDNGQTLCMEHNLLKKNYSRTEAGKRYFIQLYEDAKRIGDQKMMKFCREIFDVYDANEIDVHISRPDR